MLIVQTIKVYGFSVFDKNIETIQLYFMNKSDEESKLEISGLLNDYKIFASETFDKSGKHEKKERGSDENNILLNPWSFNKIMFSSENK